MSFADARAHLFAKLLRAACLALVPVVASVGPPIALAAGDPPPLKGPFAENFSLLDPPVPAPLEVFEDLTGAPVRLADFGGRVVLVNFWATWCAPCIREMPALDRLQAALEAEGLTVAAVSLDRGGMRVVLPFAAELGLDNIGLYLDPKQNLARAFRISGLPSTFLIDRKGGVVGAVTGPAEWDSPAAFDLVRHYLKQSRAAKPQPAAGG